MNLVPSSACFIWNMKVFHCALSVWSEHDNQYFNSWVIISKILRISRITFMGNLNLLSIYEFASLFASLHIIVTMHKM